MENPTEKALNAEFPGFNVRISCPYDAPTYITKHSVGELNRPCPRVDWILPDGTRCFAFIEPKQREITKRFLWKSWQEHVEVFDETFESVRSLIQSSISDREIP